MACVRVCENVCWGGAAPVDSFPASWNHSFSHHERRRQHVFFGGHPKCSAHRLHSAATASRDAPSTYGKSSAAILNKKSPLYTAVRLAPTSRNHSCIYFLYYFGVLHLKRNLLKCSSVLIRLRHVCNVTYLCPNPTIMVFACHWMHPRCRRNTSTGSLFVADSWVCHILCDEFIERLARRWNEESVFELSLNWTYL